MEELGEVLSDPTNIASPTSLSATGSWESIWKLSFDTTLPTSEGSKNVEGETAPSSRTEQHDR